MNCNEHDSAKVLHERKTTIMVNSRTLLEENQLRRRDGNYPWVQCLARRKEDKRSGAPTMTGS